MTEYTEVTTFAARLSELCEFYNIKLVDVANKTGVLLSTLYRYQQGQRVPKYEIIGRIASAYHVNPMWLMGYDAPMRPSNAVKGIRVPVLGTVHAGVPIDAVEDVLGYEEITPQMAMTGEFFGLIVRGDCMEPRFRDGDVVIVRQQNDAESGDIVVVLIRESEAEIRKLAKYENGSVALVPTNSAYPPAVFGAGDPQLAIVGKVVELRAKF